MKLRLTLILLFALMQINITSTAAQSTPVISYFDFDARSIIVSDLEGQERREIDLEFLPDQIRGPGWSPDGEWLAIVTVWTAISGTYGHQLWVFPRGSTTPIALPDDYSFEGNIWVEWTPEPDILMIFNEFAYNIPNFYLIDVREQRTIAALAFRPSWSPNRELISQQGGETADSTDGPFPFTVSDENEVIFSDTTERDQWFSWTPDNRLYILLEDATVLQITDPLTGDQTRIPLPTSYPAREFRWSNDGKHVLYSSRECRSCRTGTVDPFYQYWLSIEDQTVETLAPSFSQILRQSTVFPILNYEYGIYWSGFDPINPFSSDSRYFFFTDRDRHIVVDIESGERIWLSIPSPYLNYGNRLYDSTALRAIDRERSIWQWIDDSHTLLVKSEDVLYRCDVPDNECHALIEDVDLFLASPDGQFIVVTPKVERIGFDQVGSVQADWFHQVIDSQTGEKIIDFIPHAAGDWQTQYIDWHPDSEWFITGYVYHNLGFIGSTHMTLHNINGFQRDLPQCSRHAPCYQWLPEDVPLSEYSETVLPPQEHITNIKQFLYRSTTLSSHVRSFALNHEKNTIILSNYADGQSLLIDAETFDIINQLPASREAFWSYDDSRIMLIEQLSRRDRQLLLTTATGEMIANYPGFTDVSLHPFAPYAVLHGSEGLILITMETGEVLSILEEYDYGVITSDGYLIAKTNPYSIYSDIYSINQGKFQQLEIDNETKFPIQDVEGRYITTANAPLESLLELSVTIGEGYITLSPDGKHGIQYILGEGQITEVIVVSVPTAEMLYSESYEDGWPRTYPRWLTSRFALIDQDRLYDVQTNTASTYEGLSLAMQGDDYTAPLPTQISPDGRYLPIPNRMGGYTDIFDLETGESVMQLNRVIHNIVWLADNRTMLALSNTALVKFRVEED